MSYDSPINLIYNQMQTELVEQEEKLILKAVQGVGVNVDKDELIKALNYDRGQYKKGYEDRDKEIVRCKDCKYWNNHTELTYCEKKSWLGTDAEDYCSFGERAET